MNVSRVNDSPEVYAITESRTVRANPRWKSSGTRSGECVSIFPDGTRIPFTTTRTRKPQIKHTEISIARARAAKLREIAGTIRMADQDQGDFPPSQPSTESEENKVAKRSALMQKRRTGPSANTQLCIHVRLEHCHVQNCKNPVTLVKNQEGKTKRYCIEHLTTESSADVEVENVINAIIAREMWWVK